MKLNLMVALTAALLLAPVPARPAGGVVEGVTIFFLSTEGIRFWRMHWAET